jgi:hypothetical protein
MVDDQTQGIMSDTTQFNGSHEEWESVHQPYELSYHQHGNPRWPGRETIWDEQWRNVFGFAGLTRDTFNSEHVLFDVGCGSRPVLDFFAEGQKYFLDPLLSEYVKIPQMVKFWQAHQPERLFSCPGEQLIPKMVGKCDFVLSWNSLDHAYDPSAIVHNLYLYAKPGAVVLIGTDVHERPHLGHPGMKNTTAFLDGIRQRFIVGKEVGSSAFKTCRGKCFLLRRS